MLNYKGLEATYEKLIVSDAQITQQLEKLLEQRPKIIPVTGRPAQAEDEVMLDYAGYLNGEAFPGGTAEKQLLTLGSGMFIPGFEEQLIGKNIGDDVDVNVTFPEKYHAPELAGKAVVFKCHIHEIRVKSKYAMDDDFAREVGGCETMADFREAMRSSLQAYVDRQADEDLRGRLLDMACNGYECEITDELLQKAIDSEIQALEAQLSRQGLNLDLYCQFTGKTREGLREEYAADARQNIRRQYVINEIAEAEAIEADEASVAAEFSAICRDNGMTIEQLKPYINKEFETAVVRSVITGKVLDKLVEYGHITTVEKHA